MGIRRVTSVVVVFSVAILLMAQTATAKQFRWKLKEGEKLTFEMKQTITQSIDAGGMKFEIPVTIGMWMSWTVKSADAEKYVLEQVIDRMVMNMKTPEMTLDFDSDQDQKLEGPAEQVAQTFRPLVGAKITAEMNDRGEMSNVNIPDDALAGLQANPLVGQMFKKEQLTEMMKANGATFPEESIEKGHKWTVPMEMDAPPVGKMKTETSYTYAGEERADKAVLDKFNVDVRIEFSGGNAAMASVKVTEQKTDGSLYFDNEKGRMVKSNVTTNMTLAISAGGQSINQKVKQVMTVTVAPA
ncbi:MAG: hypothetical protein FJ276_22140, partial [Planctomycetes bacterium]|nr:hypothetical protein [Planctomycetota bacterium]